MKKLYMYKRYLVFNKLAIVVTVAICLCNVVMVTGSLIGKEIDWFNFFSIAATVSMSVFLCWAYVKHNLQALQAACTALLVSTAYFQASYVFENLFARSVNTYIIYGFWGSIFLATELMTLILEVMLVIYHFSINVLGRRKLVRARVNQATIVVLFVMLALEAFAVAKASLGGGSILFIVNEFCFLLQLALVYVLILCAEVVLVLDVRED